eukprot:977277-Prymnesium_polylepis.2
MRVVEATQAHGHEASHEAVQIGNALQPQLPQGRHLSIYNTEHDASAWHTTALASHCLSHLITKLACRRDWYVRICANSREGLAGRHVEDRSISYPA